MGWGRGAVAAQASHACVAAIAVFAQCADTLRYTAPAALPAMAKIVLQVCSRCAGARSPPTQAASRAQFDQTVRALADAHIDHYRWIEQPEDIATCLALRPYEKTAVAPHLAHLVPLR